MLKYCRCAGWLNTPPDFPIDSHNLKALLNLHNSEEFKNLGQKILIQKNNKAAKK